VFSLINTSLSKRLAFNPGLCVGSFCFRAESSRIALFLLKSSGRMSWSLFKSADCLYQSVDFDLYCRRLMKIY